QRPAMPLSTFAFVSAHDRTRQLDAWNRSAVDFHRDKCVHELFDAQAATTPDAIALVCEGANITFRELNNRANFLAAQLCQLGVRVEDAVGLYFERSIETVIGVLAAAKAGACYVPLDPGHPQERTQFILADADVRWIVVNTAVPEFAQRGRTVIDV